jgi:hypothetical protein
MKRIVKKLLIGLGAIIGSFIIVVIGYDVMVFQPYCSQIQAIIHDVPPLDKFPPQEVYDIAILAEGKNGPRRYVARSLLFTFGRHRQQISKWHLDYALWTFFIGIHFSDADIFALWCYFFPYEDGRGLNKAANFYYKRDLDQLTIKELISIVARARSPSYYTQHPKKLEKRVNDLLARYLSTYGDEK